MADDVRFRVQTHVLQKLDDLKITNIDVQLERPSNLGEMGASDIYIGRQEASRSLLSSAIGRQETSYDEIITVPIWAVTMLGEARMNTIVDILETFASDSSFQDFYSVESNYNYTYNDTNEILTYTLNFRRVLVENFA